MLITNNAELVSICSRLKAAPYVAVDTEFLREKTYWPKLCLVQLAHGDIAAAVDPLAPGLELAPLLELMDDENVTKVFHSASQDLEIFYRLTSRLPAPLFDTQIAASICGYGEQPGYGNLVSQMLQVDLDKTSQFTDWSRRPLTKRQVEYALSDVTYLCKIHERLVGLLESAGRLEWAQEEMAFLRDESAYRIEPRETWRRIKIRRPTRRALGVLRELAEWRETRAMERDLPRNWVVRDEALVEIASHAPETAAELERTRGLSKSLAHGGEGRAILAAVQRGLDVPEAELPQLPARKRPEQGYESRSVLLKALLKIRCDEHGIAPHMVASSDEVDRLAAGDTTGSRPLTGWRRGIFGADALELLAGRLALTIGGRDVRVIAIDGSD